MFQLDFEKMKSHITQTRGGAELTLSHLKTYQQELSEYIAAPKPEGVRRGTKESRMRSGICWYIRFQPSLDYQGAYAPHPLPDAYAIWDALHAQKGSAASCWDFYKMPDGRTPERLEMAKNLFTELAELIGRLEANA